MPLSRFARCAWAVLAYNIGVILWGAFVRASGSGAGCGAHWPMCNGEVIPQAPRMATLIEFSHRLTSGLSLILVFGLAIWAIKLEPRGSRVRRASAWAALFVAGEALIGAGLVLFELVAHDASLKRALSMCLHLTNTFFLLGALTLSAWWSSGGARIRLRGQGLAAWVLAPAFFGMLVLGASGAVTALGDTLFPATSLREGLQQDTAVAAHFLIRLRILHPFIATAVGLFATGGALAMRVIRPSASTRKLARALMALFIAQYCAGLLNVALLAPTWMQLVHLLLADLVWIALVLLAAAGLADQPMRSRNGPAPMSEVPPSTSNVAPVTYAPAADTR